jgi:predicted phosphodiesterase
VPADFAVRARYRQTGAVPAKGALEQIAVISDVHGNVTALEAVLADIAARGITRIVNLGDLIGKGPRGAEAIRLCRQACEATVRGNWDSFVSSGRDLPSADGRWAKRELSDADLAWLAGLPGTHELLMSGRRVRLFHASQASEFVRVRSSHTDDEFAAMFTNTEFTGDFTAGGGPAGLTPDVVGYGDIHRAYLKEGRGLILFSAGSVGNHLSASAAAYAIVMGVPDSAEAAPFSVGFAQVPYDIDAELAIARQLGLPDYDAYALELREGTYRGLKQALPRYRGPTGTYDLAEAQMIFAPPGGAG